MVVQRIVVVGGSEGVHARPAVEIVRTTNQFQSTVQILVGHQAVNAKSVLSIMKLAIRPGTTVEILAEGEDANEAVAALVELLEHR